MTRIALSIASILLALGIAGCDNGEPTPPVAPCTDAATCTKAAACSETSTEVIFGASAPIPVSVAFDTHVTVPAGAVLGYTFTSAAGDVVTAQIVADSDYLHLLNGQAVTVYSEVDGQQSGNGMTPELAAGDYDILLTCVSAAGAGCMPVLNAFVIACR